MDIANRFSLMIDALTELAEEEQAQQASPRPASNPPTLKSIITETSTLPDTALFLGLAEDELPILLDLYDPIPGPILIAADQAGGKTSFLQMVARAAEALHNPSEVQSAIITQYPDEWETFKDSQSVVGVYSTHEDVACELLQSLVTWAHNNKEKGQFILLLIDDLESITRLDQQAGQNMRWLLLRGPSRRIWPIVTINSSRANKTEAWLGFFRTRLFGQIKDASNSHFIANDPNKVFDNLVSSQFTMREGNNWLNFWAPAID